MGLCLADAALFAQAFLAESMLLASSIEAIAGYVSGGLKAALGLGFVIFVHELGHFAVAKWCGVQCDKFMVGFDIGGYKIGRQWGETYYGIGILPLGGYVKMMGQDDDPSKFAEQARESQAAAGDSDAKEIVGPNGQTYFVNRRSYMAKNVPQRMAIISAGVIMNVIFAFVFAFFAYGMGVPQRPTVAAGTSPGGVAWQANLRTGDRLTRIDDHENPSYEAFFQAVTLGDSEQGIVVDVERADGGRIENLRLVPKKVGSLPQVGVGYSPSLRIPPKYKPVKNSPAGQIEGGFQANDLIVAVDDVEVGSYAEFLAAQLVRKNQPIRYTVARDGDKSKTESFVVPPNPQERLGIVPVLGAITAIQKDSPAEAADLKPGDQLLAINGNYLGAAPNGEPTWDPVVVDDRLAELAAAGETAVLRIQRGDGEPIEVSVTPRIVTWDERPTARAPIAIPALGVACPLKAEVAAIIDGSPAQTVDLQPGDRLVSAKAVQNGKSLVNEDGKPYLAKPLKFGDEELNWPVLVQFLQNKPADMQIELVVARGEAEHTVTVGVASMADQFAYARGIPLLDLKENRSAANFNEQVTLAWSATSRNLTMVFRLIQKIFTGEVPGTVLGGPLMIIQAGYESADTGISTLLLFLTTLSANLAVLNFLPIPVLDGGHMVFLAYEGIRGRPANEKFVMTMQLFGMVMLLSLMLFVFGLDLGLIDRGL